MPTDPIIYVIDDDEAVRQSLEFLLTTAGMTARSFESAKAFFDVLADAEFGCVITDVRMPGDMDGLALAEWIKANRPGVEVIVTSGDALAKDVADQSLQFVAFLPKPYTGRALLDLVIQALAKRAPDIGGAAGAA